jgi:HK97 family phage major capsid protein
VKFPVRLFIVAALAVVALGVAVGFGAPLDFVAATFGGSFDPSAFTMATAAAGTLDPERISAELKRIGDETAAWRRKTSEEVSARLANVEQVIAGLDARGGSFGGGRPASVGFQALNALQEDQQFMQAAAAAGRQGKVALFNARVNVDSSIRAALTNEGRGGSSDGSIPSQPGRVGLVGPAMAPLRLLDVLPSRPVTSDSVEFVQLTATGDAAEQETEGATKAELEFAGELQNAQIATIAGWTAASKQVLSDHGALQGQVDLVLRNKVLSKLENLLINGAGGTGKIKGLLAQATTFLPTIGTTPADVVGEALVRMANNGYRPNLVVLNPLDWFRITITKTNTEGEYVFGSPTAPVPPALWNTAIVPTSSLAEGDFLCVDTNYVTVLDREQMTVTLSNSHSDFFVRNMVAILGELRAGLEVLDEFAVYKGELEAQS